MKYLYTVWIRNNYFQKDDEDHEWPACIVIEAEKEEQALEWGDYLANRFCSQNENEEFLNSKAEKIDISEEMNLNSVPQIQYGYEASDEEIGW